MNVAPVGVQDKELPSIHSATVSQDERCLMIVCRRIPINGGLDETR
jgi:hypothetical protein